MGVEGQKDKNKDFLGALRVIFKRCNAFHTSIAIKSSSKPYVPAHLVSPIKAQSPIASLEEKHKVITTAVTQKPSMILLVCIIS
jgi:hypothetical protein